ncbi:MAG: leucine-rich repeat protein, partial [Clostridia bacterium]|nr:leucine-rich repeat protein [Clostridia bacterium]
SGDFEVKIDEIKYSTRTGIATVINPENNVKTVRNQPTFNLTLDNGGENGESRFVTTVDNEFLYTISLPLEEDMNDTVSTSVSRIVYGIDGYVFDGWYTEKGGQGQKIEQFSKYNFYKDITLYAHYARPYKYSVGEEFVTITGLTDEGKRTRFPIEIPAVLDGKPVKKIGYCAFTTIGQGKTFILPNSVTEIDDYAFANCVGLQIELASVEKIGVMAFSNCGEIVLGGASRFSGSRVAVLPNTLKEIGKSAFRGTHWLTRALSPYREAYFRPELPTVMIPPSVEKIGDFAFAESGFYAVYFHRDLSLKEGDVGVSVFEGCKKLNSIYTSYNFTESGSIISTSGTSGLKVIPTKTFYNCTALVGSMALGNLKLNEGVESIGELAFASSGEGMTSLEYVAFPDSLKVIGKQAFANTGLQNVRFTSGSKLQTLGENCFQASKFEEITIYSLRTYGKAPFWGNTNLKAINILSPTLPTYTETDAWGTGLTRKAKFYVKKELLNAYRDKNSSWADGDTQDYICAYDYIVTVGDTTLAFEPINDDGVYEPTSNRVKITSVFNTTREIRIPSSITLGGVSYDVISVGKYFVHEEVTKVLLPDTLERIENRAFYTCKVLYDVVWMSGNTELKKGKNGDIALKYIGADAFNGTAISYFYSNNALTEIGKLAFHNCKNLYTVVLDLGNSLDVLGSAFSQSGLKTLVI